MIQINAELLQYISIIFNTYVDTKHYINCICESLMALDIIDVSCIIEYNTNVNSSKKCLPDSTKIDNDNIKLFSIDCFLVSRSDKITLYEASILYNIIYDKIRYIDLILIGYGEFKKKSIRRAVRTPLLKLFENDWNIYFKGIFVNNKDDDNNE